LLLKHGVQVEVVVVQVTAAAVKQHLEVVVVVMPVSQCQQHRDVNTLFA
jgi:hypothetical protein